MEEQLAELYDKLVNKIIEMIPVEWDNVYCLGEVEKGKKSWSVLFYYLDIKQNKIVRSNDIRQIYSVSKDIWIKLFLEICDTLIELYDCFSKNEQELWEQVSLFFNKEGEFSIDFYYDVRQEYDGGQIQREVVWAYNTFNYVPKEGSYSREILEQYLKQKNK